MSIKSRRLQPSHKLQCFSVACLDMPHLEFGDKVVLPPEILLELQCLKVPNPFLFSIRATGVDIQLDGELSTCSRQYCSVQEFSAPDGQVFLPYWLMQNLGVPEGGSVVVASVTNPPRAIYCRFQPETMSFLDLAAVVGPKLLMETALRRYSILSVGSTIVIEYRNTRYYVRVAELKPASVVSLCGDVDLETDFMPPDGFNLKRPSTGKASVRPFTPDPRPTNDESRVFPDNNSIPVAGYGRRLKDGGYVESTIANITGNSTRVRDQLSCKLHMNMLQKAQQSVREKQKMTIRTESVAIIAKTTCSSPLAAQLRSAQRAFSTPGYSLGSVIPVQPSNRDERATLTIGQTFLRGADRKCEICLANVSTVNMELHSLRCTKNTAYHKFECSICHEEILRIHENQHRHCPHCSELYESDEALADHERGEHIASVECTSCGTFFTRSGLRSHNGHCDHAWIPCSLCGLSFKKKDLTLHSNMCSSRTERCPICQLYITITEFDVHVHQEECTTPTQPELATFSSATVSTSSRRKPPSENAVECAYCLRGGFPDIAAVEHHVLHDCRIARTFTTEAVQDGNSNQDDSEQPKAQSSDIDRNDVPHPLLAQGRMRRKGDSSALRSTPSQSRLPTSNNQLNHLVGRTSCTSSDPSTALPKARAELPIGKQRKLKPRLNPQLRALPKRTVDDPQGKTSSDSADLCISSAGGTSFAAHGGYRANTRVKARHTAKGPSRLNKLSGGTR